MFRYNSKISFVTYIYYIFGITKLLNTSLCDPINSKLYSLSYFLLFWFILRMSNLVARYIIQFYIPRMVVDVHLNT